MKRVTIEAIKYDDDETYDIIINGNSRESCDFDDVPWTVAWHTCNACRALDYEASFRRRLVELAAANPIAPGDWTALHQRMYRLAVIKQLAEDAAAYENYLPAC